MATTTLASAAAKSPGGVRLFGRHARFGADLLALLVLFSAAFFGLALAYGRAPSIELGIDGRYTRPYLQDFHEPEAAAGQQTPSYRWTRDESTVLAPGLGRGLWITSLQLSSPIPQGQPRQAQIAFATFTLPIQLRPEPRTYRLLTPSRGDLSATIRTNAAALGSDPRELGVVFAGAAFTPVVVSALPPNFLLLYTLLALTIAFVTLRVAGLQPWLALIAPLLGLALLLAAVMLNREPLGLLLPRLAVLSGFGLIIVLALRRAWRWLVRLGRLEPEPWLLPALLTIFYLGFWIKAGGLLYPYSQAVDVGWHVRDIQFVLNGQWSIFYRPSVFSYGKMPVNEWGTNPPLLPYTPFFHMLAAPLAIFPWALDLSVNVFSVIFDANRVVLIAALALRFGLRSRGAVLAALLYAITPFTFLLHSWGNIPTTFGIFWTLLTTTVLALTYGRWHERRSFMLLTLLLLGAFLFYFVMAVFMGMFVVVLWLALVIWQRDGARQARSLLLSTALALGLSIAAYYIFFIPEMIQRTLPYVTGTVVGGSMNEGQSAPQTLGQYFGFYLPHLGYTNYPVRYGVWIPVVLGLPGLWLLRANRLALLVIGSWYAVAVLFLFAGLRISMVDKHVFYVAPALAICTAALFERLWQRHLVFKLVIAAIYVGTLVSALDIWLLRLQRVGV